MSRGLSTALLGVGVVLILLAAVNHWVLKTNLIPHTSIILGVLGLIVGAAGAYGMTMKTTAVR